MELDREPATAAEHLTFGDLLRGFRLSAGLSQEALAERSRLSADAVAALERGRRRHPRGSTVRLLSEALELGDTDRERLLRAARPQPARPLPEPAVERSVSALPDLVDEFIGRVDERGDVVSRLQRPSTRLLTLSGPGGVGKTRLAMAAVRAYAHPPGDEGAGAIDVVWVPLGALAVGTPALRAVQRAVGSREAVGDDPVASLVRTLSGRRVVVLLDDCDHLLDDCTELVEALLPACPDLQVVATSREILRAHGEQVYAVPPLPLPPPDCPVGELERFAAVRLFLTRAAALDGARRSTMTAPDTLLTVAAICRGLEGLPLAIELAAARTTVLSLDQIAAGLDDALSVLAAGHRSALARHQTLRAAIGWSYDLLDGDERALVQSLSVFSGGCDLDAARAVDDGDVLTVLSRLVDKSLVSMSIARGEARYDMLDTIRQYAAEQLVAARREGEARARHAAYFRAVARSDEAHTDPEAWLDRLDREQANLRRAIGWSLGDGGDGGLVAVTLVAAMEPYWMLRGRYFEGRDWLDRVLVEAEPEALAEVPDDHAGALLGSGTLAFLCCEYAFAHERVSAALAAYERIGSTVGRARALQRLGSIAREQAEYDTAIELHERSLRLWEELADPDGYSAAVSYMAFASWLRGALDVAEGYAERAAAHFADGHDREGLVWSQMNLACVDRHRGDVIAAEERLRRCLAVSEETSFPEGIAWSLDQLGACARARGALEESRSLLERSLSTHRELGDRWRAASVLEGLAITMHELGEAARAAYLFAIAEELRQEISAPVPPVERADRDAHLAAVRVELPAAELRRQWSLGREAQWRTRSPSPRALPVPRTPPAGAADAGGRADPTVVSRRPGRPR